VFLYAERRPLLVCSPATRTPPFFLGRLVGFVREHPLLGAAAALAFLPSDFLNARPFRGHKSIAFLFDAIKQEFAGEEPVQSLLTRFLATHLQARGAMHHNHTGVYFVDVLTAMSARAHETLFEIILEHAKLRHSAGQLGFLFRADRERAHDVNLLSSSVAPPRMGGKTASNSAAVLCARGGFQISALGRRVIAY